MPTFFAVQVLPAVGKPDRAPHQVLFQDLFLATLRVAVPLAGRLPVSQVEMELLPVFLVLP